MRNPHGYRHWSFKIIVHFDQFKGWLVECWLVVVMRMVLLVVLLVCGLWVMWVISVGKSLCRDERGREKCN